MSQWPSFWYHQSSSVNLYMQDYKLRRAVVIWLTHKHVKLSGCQVVEDCDGLMMDAVGVGYGCSVVVLCCELR